MGTKRVLGANRGSGAKHSDPRQQQSTRTRLCITSIPHTCAHRCADQCCHQEALQESDLQHCFAQWLRSHLCDVPLAGTRIGRTHCTTEKTCRSCLMPVITHGYRKGYLGCMLCRWLCTEQAFSSQSIAIASPCIACYFAYASAWEFSKRARCCETRLVVAPRPSASLQAEACPE